MNDDQPRLINDPYKRRSTHSRWYGRICGLIIETNTSIYGPFPFVLSEQPGTCGYETWEIGIDKDLEEYFPENMIMDNANNLMGFKTEPKKGKNH